MQPLRVALIGVGTVGTGVARILLSESDRIARRAGRPIVLKRAVVRDLSRPRTIDLREAVVTDQVDDVIRDPEIDVAIQLIGGTDPALDIMSRLLRAGKDVVTANKALLCDHGEELFQLAREQQRTIAFEAAVAGGVPVISALGQALSANQIVSIEAILNGTSNFILTEMLDSGTPYSDVLRKAQQLGYAETDPSMDVQGTDAAQKLTLLTRLAYGTRIKVSDFVCHGIDALELTDLQSADELGYKVKLLAVSRLVNNRLEMHVQPTLVRKDRPLAQTDGAFNSVALDGDAVGRIWLSGAGAGQMPTASAVLADLIDVAAGRAAKTFALLDLWGDHEPFELIPVEDVVHRYYLRFMVADLPHVFAEIADVLGRNGISLASIIQRETPEDDNPDNPGLVPVVVMTHRTSEGQLRAAEAELAQLDSQKAPMVRMPVSD